MKNHDSQGKTSTIYLSDHEKKIHTCPMNLRRLLGLLAKVYMRMMGTVTQTPNLAISRIPLEVPRDDILSFLLPTHTYDYESEIFVSLIPNTLGLLSVLIPIYFLISKLLLAPPSSTYNILTNQFIQPGDYISNYKLIYRPMLINIFLISKSYFQSLKFYIIPFNPHTL